MDAHKGRLLLFVLGALAVIGFGLSAQDSPYFARYRQHAQPDVLPAALVRSGRTGKELRLLMDHADPGSLSIQGFDRELRPEAMPSTTILAGVARSSGLPIVSVVASPEDLYSQRTGLVANPHSRGRGWERPVYVSYFRDGRLLFATGSGMRVHGGKSRKMLQTSFRLYFNDLYGVPGVSRQLIFGGDDVLLRSLVLHNDFRVRGDWDLGTAWHYQDAVAHFANPISYEIAGRIGSFVPATQLAQFYLNGTYLGAYVLTERVPTSDFLLAHFGHDDFFLADTRAEDMKSNVLQGVEAEWKRLQAWPRQQRPPMDMQSVAENIDLENLTNWFIGVIYLGTTDAFQGVVARDRRDASARWFWINWDMDHSFRDWYGRAARPWEIDVLRGFGNEKDPRAVVFERLRKESPEYRRYFLTRLTEVLNHELTPQFMNDLIARYERQAEVFGVENDSFFRSLKSYVQRRPDVLMAQMDGYFQSGPSHRLKVTVTGTPAPDLAVDGHRAGSSYTGAYFNGTPARIELLDPAYAALARWKVNGRVYDAPAGPLLLNLSEDTEVELLPAP